MDEAIESDRRRGFAEMSLICPKCGRVYTKFKNSHFPKHVENCSGLPLCACGCGKQVKSPTANYITGHNQRGKKQSEEEKSKRRRSAKITWDNKSQEEKAEMGAKISATKLSPEGNKRLRDAYEESRDKIIAGLVGRTPYNKLADEDKIQVVCLNCGKKDQVVPSIAKTKKYCSRECHKEYRTGRPMENWNPNSHHEASGRGISGKYKGVLFRSLIELSFVKQAFELGHTIKTEPFSIKMCDYLSQDDIDFYSIKPQQRYTPDYMINNILVYELKPESYFKPENVTADYMNKVLPKLQALEEYCKEHNLIDVLLTDEDMGELMLSYKQVKEIPSHDIEFFKERHRDKFMDW